MHCYYILLMMHLTLFSPFWWLKSINHKVLGTWAFDLCSNSSFHSSTWDKWLWKRLLSSCHKWGSKGFVPGCPKIRKKKKTWQDIILLSLLGNVGNPVRLLCDKTTVTLVSECCSWVEIRKARTNEAIKGILMFGIENNCSHKSQLTEKWPRAVLQRAGSTKGYFTTSSVEWEQANIRWLFLKTKGWPFEITSRRWQEHNSFNHWMDFLKSKMSF